MAYDLHGLFGRINHHLRTDPYLQLDKLSERLSVERHTIEKAVKRATGKTFRQFRTGMLLERTIRIMAEHPNQSIKEVAFSLGYNSQRSVCRFIRAKTGYSPKEFRAKNLSSAGLTV